MALAQLRKVGGSAMVAVPPAVLAAAGWSSSSTVDIAFDAQSNSVVLRSAEPRYSLEELMAQCDFAVPMSDKDREWFASPAVGREIV